MSWGPVKLCYSLLKTTSSRDPMMTPAIFKATPTFPPSSPSQPTFPSFSRTVSAPSPCAVCRKTPKGEPKVKRALGVKDRRCLVTMSHRITPHREDPTDPTRGMLRELKHGDKSTDSFLFTVA